MHEKEPTKLCSALLTKSEISLWSKFSIPGTIKVICCGLMDEVTPFCHGKSKRSLNNKIQAHSNELMQGIMFHQIVALAVQNKTWSNTIQFFLPSGLTATASNTFAESFLNSRSVPFANVLFWSLSSRSSPPLVKATLWSTKYCLVGHTIWNAIIITGCCDLTLQVKPLNALRKNFMVKSENFQIILIREEQRTHLICRKFEKARCEHFLKEKYRGIKAINREQLCYCLIWIWDCKDI